MLLFPSSVPAEACLLPQGGEPPGVRSTQPSLAPALSHPASAAPWKGSGIPDSTSSVRARPGTLFQPAVSNPPGSPPVCGRGSPDPWLLLPRAAGSRGKQTSRVWTCRVVRASGTRGEAVCRGEVRRHGAPAPPALCGLFCVGWRLCPEVHGQSSAAQEGGWERLCLYFHQLLTTSQISFL